MEFNKIEVTFISCYSKPYDFTDKKSGNQKVGTSYKIDIVFNGAFATFKTNEIVFNKLAGKTNTQILAVFKMVAFNRIPSVVLVDIE